MIASLFDQLKKDVVKVKTLNNLLKMLISDFTDTLKDEGLTDCIDPTTILRQAVQAEFDVYNR